MKPSPFDCLPEPLVAEIEADPLPNFSRIRSTVIRVPETTGFSIITFGSETISGSAITNHAKLHFLAHGVRPTHEQRRTVVLSGQVASVASAWAAQARA